MESFLDEYQIVRLTMSGGGLVLMAILLVVGNWDDRVAPVAVALVLVGAHAIWCRLRHIRLPRTMLALDLTLWGWVMVLISDDVPITTASLAFLALLTVLFSSGGWTVGFLTYIAAWYGISFFVRAGSSVETIGVYVSVLFTVGGVVAVMWRVKRWLGRLDANRSQMLGMVSHELRNNLTGMIGMTELVGSEELDPAEVRELIALAHLQAVDAAEMVEDLLTATRLERSALHVEMTPVDVNGEVETTVRRFAGEGMAIEVDLFVDLPTALGDTLRVRQVLRNLVSNAARYGGSSVAVRTTRDGDHVCIVVSDDGEGVPGEDEGTIFLPYRRSTTAKRHLASVGLGLWISRQLAYAMGGSLEYQRVNDRTEFVFTLGTHDAEGPGAGAPGLNQPAGAKLRKSLSRLGDLASRGSIVVGEVARTTA
jgi:signal transduction histidine kinase